MKDAYYFPHFSNARNDQKVVRLRRILGIEGYGIYFMLLEVLRDQKDFRYPVIGIEDLSFDWHVSKEKILSVINDFDLFTIDQDHFFSLKFNEYMTPYLEKSKRARHAALLRWNNANAYANANANALPEHCNGNASKVKESKVKESKEKEKEGKKAEKSARSRFIIPEFDDVLSFFIEKGFQEEAENYYNYYQSNGWMVGRTKMKDWMAAASNWIKRSQTQFKPKTNGTNGSAKKSFTEAAREWVTG